MMVKPPVLSCTRASASKHTLVFGITRRGNPTLSPSGSIRVLKNVRSVLVNRLLTSPGAVSPPNSRQRFCCRDGKTGRSKRQRFSPWLPTDFGVQRDNLEFGDY